MGQTVTERRRLPGKQKRTEALIERDIAIYQRHMAGLSVRAIGDEFAIKSSQTVWGAIQRGRELVKERGVDLEERRIEIDEMFKNTLGHLAGEIARQADEGRIVEIERSNGSKEIRRTRGIDPKTAEALARSADRWAQFLGITDRANETSQQTTLISLAPPVDAAAFEAQWANAGETVNVTPSERESECSDLQHPANTSSGQLRATAAKAVETANQALEEAF